MTDFATPDATHDPALRSWVASAQAADTDFPLQNLPFGRFRAAGSTQPWRIGVAIGDQVLDLREACIRPGWPAALRAEWAALADGDLNAFMARPAAVHQAMRQALSAGLAAGSAQQADLAGCLVAQTAVALSLPCRVGDYTDFYTGIHHATAVGALFRPDQPLLPNYKWVPIGYHGRSSSLVVSGTPVRRPHGQLRQGQQDPQLAPTRRLDHELELGFLVAAGNAQGQAVPLAEAEGHLFGVTLLNDWSARDIQAWEYQPLGPFLSKSFATTLSPWVVTMQALRPFRAPFTRPAGDPAPLPYLDGMQNRAAGQLDIELEVWLHSARMREQGQAPVRISRSRVCEAAYWTAAQLVAHHTVNGCNLQPGDLLGSGTLSGPGPGEAGSMLELTLGGQRPLTLPNGETRSFLEDGDTVTLRAACRRPGAVPIGWGDCSGTVIA